MTIQASDLQKQLPELVGDGSILAEAFSIDADSLNQTEADRLDVFNQMFVEHGTWGLKFWEVFLGIVTDETQSTETRRRMIKNKIIAGSQVFTLKRLVEVLNSYGFAVSNIIEKTSEYLVEVQVPNVINSVSEVMGLAKYLRIVFPAHLSIKLSAINRSMNALTTIDDIGPILTVKYDSDVYILGIRDNQLYTITKYQVFDNEFAKDTVVNIASAYPDYEFDPYNAAAHYSGKIYIPCTSKTPAKKPLATAERNLTVGSNNLYHASLTGQIVMNHDDVNTQITQTSRRLVIADRNTGAFLYPNLRFKYLSEFHYTSTTSNEFGNIDSFWQDGFASHTTFATTTYQFFDKSGDAIGNKITPTLKPVDGSTVCNEEFYLSSFPAGAFSIEFTMTVQRPALTTYYNNANGFTYKHVSTVVNMYLDSDVVSRVMLEDKTYYESYIAEVNMSTGAAVFHNVHTLLNIPIISKHFMLEETFNRTELKLHVDEANNYLYAICGYGLGLESTGVYDGSANNLCIAKIDRATMTVVNKNTIASGALYSQYDKELVDKGSYPAYADGAINDYVAGNETRVGSVYRHTSYVDKDFMRNFYIISGISGDYLVSYSRKVKYHTYTYHWNSAAVPGYEAKRYLGSCVRLPSESSEITKYPSIKVIDLNNLQVREVTNEDLLELCRTSVCTRDMTRAPFGSECTKTSESKAYGLPLTFIATRPASVIKPPLNGSGADDDYRLPLSPFTQTALHNTQLNGSKFVMTALDKETLGLNVRFEYTYNNFQTINFDPIKDKVPVYPTNIMPDLTLWMDTSFNLSLEGNPPLLNVPVPPVPYTQYPAGYVGSFFYPYKKADMVYSEPFNGSIITSVVLYKTVDGNPITRYITQDKFFMNHASRDEYGLGNAVYATYDNSSLTTAYNGHVVTNADKYMGKKLARFIKVPYNSYMLFSYV